MSEQEKNPKPADADSNWSELKASEGDKYRVKASDYDISSADEDAPAASGPTFANVAVNWGNGSSGSPPGDVQDRTSITWYKLSKTPWYNAIYSYELSFNCNDTYNFGFTDATGDCYWCNVWQNGGTHYVQFNSSNPTIVKIQGS